MQFFTDLEQSLNVEMDKGLTALKGQLQRVRTGRANQNILDRISVDYYGALTPLKQLGQITTPEARLLMIRPFDKGIITAIEKAIVNANIGATPVNDGNFIRIPFPSLTEEKRKDLVKEVKKLGEDAKIVLRNIRRDFNDKVKEAEKGKLFGEDDSKKFQESIQNITTKFIESVDSLVSSKEEEILTI